MDGSSSSSSRGPRHQRPADGQHLLLAAGHGAGQLGAPLSQAGEQRKHPVHVLLDRPRCLLRVKAPSSKFSTTVIKGKTRRALRDVGDAQLTTMRSGGNVVSSCPSKVMLPRVGGTSPEIVRSVVLLPAPLAPMRVTISPGSTCREMPFRASTGP